MLFVFLAIILLVIVVLIIVRWKDGSEIKPPTTYQTQAAPKKTISPSFISNEKGPTTEKKPAYKPPVAMRDVPAYPAVPNEPRKPESFTAQHNKKPDQNKKVNEKPIFDKQKKSQQNKPSNFKFEKPQPPKGPVVPTQNVEQNKPKTKSADPPWLKKEPKQELIKPATPPPKPADNNFPWQTKKDNNEQPPGPTVNI